MSLATSSQLEIKRSDHESTERRSLGHGPVLKLPDKTPKDKELLPIEKSADIFTLTGFFLSLGAELNGSACLVRLPVLLTLLRETFPVNPEAL